jgi:thioredoxin reductase
VTVAHVDEHRQVWRTRRLCTGDTLFIRGPESEKRIDPGRGHPDGSVYGGAQVDETRQGSVPGIFACGHVCMCMIGG